jgi:3-deoxy-D-manno-octulosonic-acid transferase
MIRKVSGWADCHDGVALVKRGRHRSDVLSELVYRLGMNVGVPLASLVLRRPALHQGHRGRLAAVVRLEEWAHTHRDPMRPLAWFHAASVGEGLQARAVLTALRQLRPDLQVVATRFSASAERLGRTMPADVSEYIPYDRRRDVARVLAALRPDMLAFAKLDVWPELATAAAERGARVALIAGSVDPGSARLGWLAATMARRGYAALELAGAISAEDAERLVLLGVARERIVVTGDPRVDAVLETVADTQREHRGVQEEPDPDLLVAGSTWPQDEVVLLDALTAVRRWFPGARLIVVPHEPTPAHVAALRQRAVDRGLSVATWTGDPGGSAAVTIVERMGVLTALYARGAVAYVGGGFGDRGIHSVLEPAGWHRPVLIGPNDRGVRDARLLSLAGGLVRLPQAGAAETLATQWSAWLEHPSAREVAGRRAGNALAADRGAAHRSAELLAALRYP